MYPNHSMPFFWVLFWNSYIKCLNKLSYIHVFNRFIWLKSCDNFIMYKWFDPDNKYDL